MPTENGSIKAMFEKQGVKMNGTKEPSKPAAKKPQKNTDTDFDPENIFVAAGSKPDKRLSIERIYQKKSHLDHILLRPDSYIGTVESITQPMWIFDDTEQKMIQKDLTYVPGLFKIFDEIVVNAADNKQRDPKMSCVKIDIDPENNRIKVWNNGRGIPVVKHQVENVYVPTLIFGTLLTSSNYDDSQKKVTGGRNGFGAKLCNIFSNKFVVETQSNEYKKHFKQSWTENMMKASDAKVKEANGEDFTSVTFYPDLSRFNMDKLDQDIVDLFTRRAYDIAASSQGGLRVFLNGKRLPIKSFKDYIDLYMKDRQDDNGDPLKLVFESVSPRWEVGVTLSDKGFQQASFVNSIATTKGGNHVNYIANQVADKVIEIVRKKEKKGGLTIKPFQIKNHLWVFVNCLIENPTFDSQTKDTMTLELKRFGSKCQLSDKFINQVNKCGIVEAITSWMRFKVQEKLNKKCHTSKHSKIKGVNKLDDANNAGTKNSIDCTLILTEGDSAKSLAVAGLGVIGRDRYGVFPLKGKLLNVREATNAVLMKNEEISNMIKILGLQFKNKYEDYESLKTLRYGKIMVMADQDQDGSHIKGLVINFIHHHWPNLLKHNFVEEFITPIVKVSKKKHPEISFYSLPEFEEWKKNTENWHTWSVKYYKGLGTSTSREAKEYFSDMARHRIRFRYNGSQDDSAIVLAFSKKKIEERKVWLTNFMEERNRRQLLGLPELYLYGKDTKQVNFSEFVNRELILFSNMDNERSIPALLDGFKPGQRKVMFTCFKRNLTKQLKVAQLAGSVAEISAYHHGEASLMSTIVNLAQNFVGSNNLNLLMPWGQFGTRLHGGKDAASPRYIFTCLNSVTRLLFHPDDEPLLESQFDDNVKIEPRFYAPIIPMVLVNGAEGIGTGWSTKIPNFDVRAVVNNINRMLTGMSPAKMTPSYKSFTGTIEEVDPIRFACSGEISILNDTTVEISELPIKTWTQTYKEAVLEVMLNGTEKTPATIQDYKEYHTESTVKFIVKMSAEKLAAAEAVGLHKYFKLQTSLSMGSMVLFDSKGCLRRYNNVEEIMQEFYDFRLELYSKRKSYLEGMLAAESLQLDNKARFITEVLEKKISILNKLSKKELVKVLISRGYDSDPVKEWKKAQEKEADLLAAAASGLNSQDEEEEAEPDQKNDYNYLFSLPMLTLTKEKVEELLKNRDQKADELHKMKMTTNKDLWKGDLEKFLKQLEIVEKQEIEDDNASITTTTKTAKGRTTKLKKQAKDEYLPSPHGRRVQPVIDQVLRNKYEAAEKKKMKKEEKENKLISNDILDEMKIDDDSDVEFSPLSERIKSAINTSASPELKRPTKKPTKVQRPKELDSDSDASFSPSTPSPKKKAPVKRKAADNEAKKTKPKAAPKKKVKKINSSDDDLSDIEPTKTKSKPAPKRKANKNAFSSDDDESDFGDSDFEDYLKKEKKVSSYSDEESQVAARQTTGRQRKQVKYNFDSDSDDDSDF